MPGFITVTDQGGKKVNVQVSEITHFYDHYIWVAGSVTIEVKELAGQIAMLIERMPTRAPKQFSKRDVGYTDDHGDSTEQCSKCEHFGEPSSCEIVAGEISPQGWCRKYEMA